MLSHFNAFAHLTFGALFSFAPVFPNHFRDPAIYSFQCELVN